MIRISAEKLSIGRDINTSSGAVFTMNNTETLRCEYPESGCMKWDLGENEKNEKDGNSGNCVTRF